MIDEPQPQDLPLTTRRKVLAAGGAAMFLAQVLAAIALAPPLTGDGDANALALGGLWLASIGWSAATALLIVRQADTPDVATAAFIVTISAFSAFTLMAAVDAQGSTGQVDLVDALFLGVTGGALTALIVWGLAHAAARLLRLPTTEALRADE